MHPRSPRLEWQWGRQVGPSPTRPYDVGRVSERQHPRCRHGARHRRRPHRWCASTACRRPRGSLRRGRRAAPPAGARVTGSVTAPAEQRRPNSLVTSAVTGGALAMQILLSIVVGFVVGRVLGRSDETDGFFAAYAVFMVLSLAANAARLVVLPAFAGARAAGRLAHELMTSFAALAVLLVPATVVVLLAREPLATLLTGGGSAISVDTAADNLVWLAVAGLGQVVAGMLASALAAFDEYVVPAVGYLIASAAGLTLIVLTIHDARTLAIGHGLTLSACLAILVPGVWLVRQVARSPHPVGWRASRPRWAHVLARLKALVTGSTLPVRVPGAVPDLPPLRRPTRSRFADHAELRLHGLGSRGDCRRLRHRTGDRSPAGPQRADQQADCPPHLVVLLVGPHPCGLRHGTHVQPGKRASRQAARSGVRKPGGGDTGDGALHGRIGRVVDHVPGRARARS